MTFYTLILQISSNRSWGISNSDRSRWKLTEQTMIRVRINLVQHTQCSKMTWMTQRQESLIREEPGNRIHLALEKLKMAFSSRLQNWRTILMDWENKCIVATKQHRGVHKDSLYQPRNTNSLRDTAHALVVCVVVEWTLRQLRITKRFRSCWPAWLEMDRKVCPSATTSLHGRQYHAHGLQRWACCQTSSQECQGRD